MQTTSAPTDTPRRGLRRGALIALGVLGISLGSSLATAAPASAATIIGGVDMQRACTKQYPGMGLTAVVLDGNNAYSWKCRSPWGYTGGINVNAACGEQYGGGAYSTVLNPRDPYSWRCVR
jgi:hypothetical protein